MRSGDWWHHLSAPARGAARRRSYAYIADMLGIPLNDCHISHMNDIEQLREFYRAAKRADARGIRVWWKAEGSRKYEKRKTA